MSVTRPQEQSLGKKERMKNRGMLFIAAYSPYVKLQRYLGLTVRFIIYPPGKQCLASLPRAAFV